MRVASVAFLILFAGCLDPAGETPGTPVAPTDATPPALDQPRAIAIRSLAEGQQGGPESPERGSYDSEAEWAAASGRYPAADATIDFNEETVVSVALGQRGDGCWAIRVTNATLRADSSVLVEVTTYEPPSDMMCAQVVTYPYHVVALEGSFAEVAFQERNATYGAS